MSMPETKKSGPKSLTSFGGGARPGDPAGKTGLFCMNPRLFCGKKGPGVV